jgi:hypothetical protein
MLQEMLKLFSIGKGTFPTLYKLILIHVLYNMFSKELQSFLQAVTSLVGSK